MPSTFIPRVYLPVFSVILCVCVCVCTYVYGSICTCVYNILLYVIIWSYSINTYTQSYSFVEVPGAPCYTSGYGFSYPAVYPRLAGFGDYVSSCQMTEW